MIESHFYLEKGSFDGFGYRNILGKNIFFLFLHVMPEGNVYYCESYVDRVIFLEPLERKTPCPVIERAYVCFVLSRTNNMPNTCIEVMTMGKIVIGAKRASCEQLIEDGRNGF